MSRMLDGIAAGAGCRAMRTRILGLLLPCVALMALAPVACTAQNVHAAPAAPAAPAAGKFFFHDGDSPIVLLGDSITEQKMYTTYMETYVLTRFPKWHVTVRNIGWGGDTSWFSQRKSYDNGMKRDVMPLKPAAITIDFGMNDARGGDNQLPKYIEYSTKLAHDLKAAGARVALVTSSPEERYEANQPAGSNYNRMLAKYSDALKIVAQKEGVLFVDQFTPFVKVIEEGRKAGLLGTSAPPRLIPDGVHPNWAGHLVMAASILKGLGAPSLVSSLTIDAAGKKVVAAECCTAEFVNTPAGTIAFRRTDACLPCPMVWPIKDAVTLATATKIPGFTPLDDLNRYMLKVTGLAAAKYDLAIDDQKVGTFTKDELAAGVNLALTAGPINDQGNKLFQAIIDKNNTYYQRWRNTLIPALPGGMAGEVDATVKQKLDDLDKSIATKEKAIDALRQPKPHVFKLTPAQ